MEYGFSITWTKRDKSITTVKVYDHATLESAKNAAIKSAAFFGWTQPKWWQWWRREDTKVNT